MPLAKPTLFHYPFANEATGGFINTVPDAPTGSALASWREGFPPVTMTPLAGGGSPPYGADFNGVLKTLSENLRWLLAGGAAFYDAALVAAMGGYPAGAVITLNDGFTRVICITAGATADPNLGVYNNQGWAYMTEPATASALSDPTGTSVVSGVMMGLGAQWTVTPRRSGILFVSLQGTVGNSQPAGSVSIGLARGTGTPPINGAALTGTPIASYTSWTSATAGARSMFNITTIAGILTRNTQHWIDASLQPFGAGGNVADIKNLAYTLFEL